MATLKLVLLGLLPLVCVATRDQAADDVVSSDWEPERAEAFVQHKRLHSRSGGRGKCDGEKLRNHCPRSAGSYLEALKGPAAQAEGYKPRLGRGDELLKDMKDSDPQAWQSSGEARKAFEAIRHLDARKVLAFKETWTTDDSNILKQLGSVRDGWVDGPFSHAKFLGKLPSIKILEDLIDAGPMAIVGAGPSLVKKGDAVDGHPTVVRFNSHIGKELNRRDTGTKMTVHVLNGHVDFGNEPGVLHFDLESTYPGSSMCHRWYNQQETLPPHDEVTLLFRPSAVCGMPESIASFTRGFLFYWLVGRLAEQSDNYGMGFRDGLSHKVRDQTMVNERFLDFEHALYKAADRVQARKAEEAKAAEAQKKATLAAQQVDAHVEAAVAATTMAAVETKAAATTAEPATTKAAATPEKVEATTAAPKKDEASPAATTAAAPAVTTAAAPAVKTGAVEQTTAAEAATTAAAPVTTGVVEKATAVTTEAPVVTTEAAVATTAVAEVNATNGSDADTAKDNAAAKNDTMQAPKNMSGEESPSKVGNKTAPVNSTKGVHRNTTKHSKSTKHKKPMMKHMKSGTTSHSAFALATLISAATWMLHM